MRLPRISIRRMMIVVAFVAVAARLATLADHVRHDLECRWIFHDWERIDNTSSHAVTTCTPPFWPQYWRKAMGLSWPGTFRCDCPEIQEIPIEIRTGRVLIPHRYLGSRPVTREEAEGIWFCHQSLKNLSIPIFSDL